MANEFFGCDGSIGRDDLITCLYKSRKLDQAIKNHCDSIHNKRVIFEEIKQELFVILCERDILSIHSKGYLDYYILYTLRNLSINVSLSLTLLSEIQIEDDEYIDDLGTYTDKIKALAVARKKLNYFESYILDRYADCRSLQKIAEETEVDRKYITKLFKNAKKIIKKELIANTHRKVFNTDTTGSELFF